MGYRFVTIASILTGLHLLSPSYLLQKNKRITIGCSDDVDNNDDRSDQWSSSFNWINSSISLSFDYSRPHIMCCILSYFAYPNLTSTKIYDFDIFRPQILPYIFVLCLLVVIALAVAYRIWRVGIDNFLGFWIRNWKKFGPDFLPFLPKYIGGKDDDEDDASKFVTIVFFSEQTLATGCRPIRLLVQLTTWY